jgi:hypothetical protein
LSISDDKRLDEIDAIVRRYLDAGCVSCRVSSGLVAIEVSRRPEDAIEKGRAKEDSSSPDKLASEDGEPAHVDRIQKIKELSYYSA